MSESRPTLITGSLHNNNISRKEEATESEIKKVEIRANRKYYIAKKYKQTQ